MFIEAISAVKDLGRLQHIVSILIRYGFGEMVNRLGMSASLEKAGKKLHWNYAEQHARLDFPQRIRMALEEMGPTFIKLGQILATRIDLFPPEWIREFEKLQRDAPHVPFDSIREQLEEDLGIHVSEIRSHADGYLHVRRHRFRGCRSGLSMDARLHLAGGGRDHKIWRGARHRNL